MAKTSLEERFYFQCVARHIEEPKRELRFHATRLWRFDFAWPTYMIAVEIQGGVWSGGAHGRGSGIRRNYEKYNAAAIDGWWVLQGDERMVSNCSLVEDLVRALATTTPLEHAGGANQ